MGILPSPPPPSSALPLLQSSSPVSTGTATSLQTLGNIIVSIVGTGVLGLPFAFKIAGWAAGSLGVLFAGLSTYYCMIILVECRDKLVSDGETDVRTYGDVGFKCFGRAGRYLTEALITITHCGGAVAYLIFIGQNLSSILTVHGITYVSFIFLLLPLEILLSWIDSLSALAPFSIFADVCNVLAMAFVVNEDVHQALSGQFSFKDRRAFSSNIRALPFAGGMAVFCFEGFGMTLALESSMKERGCFPKLLAQAFAGIVSVYVLFGVLGYMAYGDDAKDIVTLNLPQTWTTIAVQIGLCLGLAFTFPIMVHPITEIFEEKLRRMAWFKSLHRGGDVDSAKSKRWRAVVCLIRGMLILGLGVVASSVPGFGVFVSLVGSSFCAMISFVFPATYHLMLMGGRISAWRKGLDWCVLVGGITFAVYGTYNTIAEI
ncbi:hypothetical protein MLD38_033144 [Melastoma candidum]|uniref:Uncharacterized protein n=1 Tax=Melastoma candidum TaxID=119954 RepID=A0ACB9M5J9_9MYRT|nr:hypothetical protein MLD38_033144 [Melastoma candidum]